MEEKKAKMLKFIMGKGHQPTAERLKVQKELFGFNRVSFYDSFCWHESSLIFSTDFLEKSGIIIQK